MAGRYMKILSFLILFLGLMPFQNQACTTFSLDDKGQTILGKNYDWYMGHGILIANKRGVSKTAMPDRRTNNVGYASWTSKYGSLTFNQYGRELPMGGMNEAGLVVELLMLAETAYPQPDSRLKIKDLQWVQYQLDNYNSVEEVIRSDSKIRILHFEEPGLHFMVKDKSGNSASIEFLNGKLVYHSGETLPVKVLTNDTYQNSISYFNRFQKSDSKNLFLNSISSLNRFVTAANMVNEYNPQAQPNPVNYAFEILAKVADGTTKWSIVYDLDNLRVHFRTATNRNIRTINLRNLDFSCSTPVKVLDMEKNITGNITEHFQKYTRQINQKIVNHAFARSLLSGNIPNSYLNQRIVYPENTTCVK